MRSVLIWVGALALAGCSTPNTPDLPPGGTPPPGGGGAGACTHELSENLTVGGVLANTPSDCDYLIRGPVSIENGQFIIEPGVVVKFEQDASLSVDANASLQAVGTPQARITFEGGSPVKGFAKGLFFGSDSLPSRVDYADFRYLGKQDTGVYKFHNGAISGLDNGGLALTNTSVSGSLYYGAELDDVVLSEFANNIFYDNALYSVVIGGSQVHKLDAASDYLGGAQPNGRPYVLVEALTDEVFESATWKRLNVPYFVESAVYIEAGTVTLEPGVQFVFGQGGGIDIDDLGALTAIGTSDAPIVFIGEQPQPGYWDGLSYFESPSRENVLSYAEVHYAGGGDFTTSAVSVGLESYLNMSYTTVSNSAGWGVCVTYIGEEYQSIFEQGQGNVFFNNASGDVEYDCE